MATPTTITGEHSLQRLTAAADRLDGVRKRDLSQGDWVLVTTKNSLYVICALGNDLYQVSGGYFDRKGCRRPPPPSTAAPGAGPPSRSTSSPARGFSSSSATAS